MKAIILLLLGAAAAQAQLYTPGGWQMVGTTVGTNTAYAVIPRNARLNTLHFFSDNTSARLKLLYPKVAYTISNSMYAGAGSNLSCTAELFAIPRGDKVIIWSQTNNQYQVATVLSNLLYSIRLSNETYAAYATNINPIHPGDVVYSTTEYWVSKIPMDSSFEPLPVVWGGMPFVMTPQGMPMAYHMYLPGGAAGQVTNIYVNAWGTR